jgi:hypothetical protein
MKFRHDRRQNLQPPDFCRELQDFEYGVQVDESAIGLCVAAKSVDPLGSPSTTIHNNGLIVQSKALGLLTKNPDHSTSIRNPQKSHRTVHVI